MNIVSILVDGKEINPLQVKIVESVNTYYNYVTFVTQQMLTTRDIQMRLDTTENYKIIGVSFRGTSYEFTAVHEKTNKLLNTTFTEFTGQATVQGLCASIGIPLGKCPLTNNSFWMIPSSKLKTVVGHITNYAAVSNGGGSRCFINLKGELELVDYKFQMDRLYPSKACVSVKSDVANTDWSLDYSGEFEIITGRLDKITSESVALIRGYSKSVVIVNDTTGFSAGLAKQGVHNQFWYRYYSSRIVTVDYYNGNVDLGSIVCINDTSKKYLVAVKETIVESSGNPKSVKLILHSNVEDN